MFEQVMLVGRLGRDPEMRFTPAGQAVTNFSIAVDRKFTKADGTAISETKWFRIEVWGKMAEACNTYLHKGKLVMVEGRTKVDPETGCPRVYKTEGGDVKAANLEIVANTVKFLSPKDGAEDGAEAPAEEPAQEIAF